MVAPEKIVNNFYLINYQLSIIKYQYIIILSIFYTLKVENFAGT